MTRSAPAHPSHRTGRSATVYDPVRLEIYRNLFVSVCEEMGIALMKTGCSPNIKERRDYSCAVFDSTGRAVAMGDHMPVHLGSMPASVAAALQAFVPGPGDVILLNDPFSGGTHLPDITLVAPFFAHIGPGGRRQLAGARGPKRPDRDRTARAAFFLANRAHHSDVGGMSPGSMPLATDIHQEGLVLPPVRIVRGGVLDRDLLSVILANCRTPREREGDLRAQLAALRMGERRLRGMIGSYGLREVESYARHLQSYSGRIVRRAIGRIPAGTYHFVDYLDGDGSGSERIPLPVALSVRGSRAIVDFRGCPDQVSGGVNAVASITLSAVYYVFRCLVSSLAGPIGEGEPASGEVPWNAGGFEPIEVRLRPGSILAANRPAAVAGGNVETSQRIVDVLLGALAKALPGRIPAASQGTMNNLGLGGRDPRTGDAFAYYETVAGGMGGRPAGAGLSGAHTHMTNSLNTPIEALESALPLTVERTTLRRGSGGAGRHPGGDGIVRALSFEAPTSASLLTERRLLAPWGIDGGRPGARGANRLVLGRGTRVLPPKVNVTIRAGETLVIETPGGGGWGRPARPGPLERRRR